jgi:hypothetical protein
MEIKVFSLKHGLVLWMKLILFGVLTVLCFFALRDFLVGMGLNPDGLPVYLIPPLVTIAIFWIVLWCGLSYGKGPMKFLSKL